jgi:hypothetical protein
LIFIVFFMKLSSPLLSFPPRVSPKPLLAFHLREVFTAIKVNNIKEKPEARGKGRHWKAAIGRRWTHAGESRVESCFA